MDEMIKILQDYATESESLKTWALSILGGSIAIMIGSSHVKPVSNKWRFIYLLFIPAWILSALSVYFGTVISREVIAAKIVKNSDPLLDAKFDLINYLFANQMDCFNYSIIFYTCWIILYLVWWFINHKENATEAQQVTKVFITNTGINRSRYRNRRPE